MASILLLPHPQNKEIIHGRNSSALTWNSCFMLSATAKFNILRSRLMHVTKLTLPYFLVPSNQDQSPLALSCLEK